MVSPAATRGGNERPVLAQAARPSPWRGLRRCSVGAALGLLLLASGCSPSHRLKYQSHIFFEQCHAADVDPALNTEQRAACWSSWLRHYTLGQPQSRVSYAHARADALAHGESLPALSGLNEAKFDAVYTARFLSMDGGETDVQDPDSAGAEALTEHQLRAAEPGAGEASPRQSPCARVCEPRYTTCVASCDETQTSCLKTCRAEEKTCLSACL